VPLVFRTRRTRGFRSPGRCRGHRTADDRGGRTKPQHPVYIGMEILRGGPREAAILHEPHEGQCLPRRFEERVVVDGVVSSQVVRVPEGVPVLIPLTRAPKGSTETYSSSTPNRSRRKNSSIQEEITSRHGPGSTAILSP
jgi:hypothetical protein